MIAFLILMHYLDGILHDEYFFVKKEDKIEPENKPEYLKIKTFYAIKYC